MEKEKKLSRGKKPLRLELERAAYSTNIFLKDAVSRMSNIILLRNVHPLLRFNFGQLLYDEGMLTKEAAAEFIKRF